MRLADAQFSRLGQPLRPHFSQIDCRPQGEQPLVGADVAGRLFAADVLLAGLKRQHPAAAAPTIDRLPGNAPRHPPYELLAAGHDSQIRPAE
jgi:hypothetical protein